METSSRSSCFGNDGLASIAEIEAPGYSGAGDYNPQSFLSRTVVPRRRGSIRNLSSLSSSGTAGLNCSSPRSGRVYDSRFEEAKYHSQPPHFLEACFLCKKPLGFNRDIFMYRGDTPFCSEECRQDQIDEDEAKEKKRNLSASVKAMRSQKKESSSVQISDYSYRPGTVAAA